MYEDYTRQALPSKYYRELLGSAMCVFNSNNAFIISLSNIFLSLHFSSIGINYFSNSFQLFIDLRTSNFFYIFFVFI